MCLCFYPILCHVPQGAGGAAPLFSSLLGLPWLEGEVGEFLDSESTESKAHRREKQRELRHNRESFLSVQGWGKVQRFPYWPTALAIRREQVRDGGTHLWLLHHWQVPKDLSKSSKSTFYRLEGQNMMWSDTSLYHGWNQGLDFLY